MSSQHEANILGGCTEDARYIHGGYTLHPRKGTLKTGNPKQSRAEKLPKQSFVLVAGEDPRFPKREADRCHQLLPELFRSSFGQSACKAE